jgi:predicted amidohydrolase
VPNACELEANRLGQVRARAFENMVAVAVANYAAPQGNGHSTVLDLAALRDRRRREVWGSQCRRPGTCGALVASRAHGQEVNRPSGVACSDDTSASCPNTRPG